MRVAARFLGLRLSKLEELVETGALQVITLEGHRLVQRRELQRLQSHLEKAVTAARAEAEIDRQLSRARDGAPPPVAWLMLRPARHLFPSRAKPAEVARVVAGALMGQAVGR